MIIICNVYMVIKGSWEAIFRVTEKWNCEIILNEGWYVSLHHMWVYIICEFTSHNNEKCETILNEWWCVSLHHITVRSVRLYSMNGGVWCVSLHYITMRSVRPQGVDSSTPLELNHDLNRYYQMRFNLSLPGVNSRLNSFCCWIILEGLNPDLFLC